MLRDLGTSSQQQSREDIGMRFTCILLHVLICWFCKITAASQCKAASYSIQDHVLINHAIKAGPAELIEHCITQCLDHPGCHSSNFYRISKWCELNDKTHTSHPEDMKQVPFTNYMENTLRPLQLPPTCKNDSDCGSSFFCFQSKCEECGIHALGMESKALPDSAIIASSFIAGREPWLARLNNVPIANGHRGAWAPAKNEVGQWLQIDLGKERLLAKLATQGRPSDPSMWVTSYKIDFSLDSVKWEEYKENDAVKVFEANSDRDTIVSHVLTPRFRARYVRFVVLNWHRYISMRVELYGCVAS